MQFSVRSVLPTAHANVSGQTRAPNFSQFQTVYRVLIRAELPTIIKQRVTYWTYSRLFDSRLLGQAGETPTLGSDGTLIFSFFVCVVRTKKKGSLGAVRLGQRVRVGWGDFFGGGFLAKRGTCQCSLLLFSFVLTGSDLSRV